MKKKITVISVFTALILFTAVFFLISTMDVYRTEMEKPPDIFPGFNAAFLALVGAYDQLSDVFYILRKYELIALSLILIDLAFRSVYVLPGICSDPKSDTGKQCSADKKEEAHT